MHEGEVLLIIMILALAGICGMIGYFVGLDKHVKENSSLRMRNAEQRMELDERNRRIEELIDSNREYMKQLNEKQQNVSRETSYNKSYGMPEVVDWINQQYPPTREDN